MKYLFIFFFIFPLQSWAQYSISGKVNSSNREPVPYVNVILFNAESESIVTVTVSSDDGSYFFENIPEGDYYIKTETIGYKSVKTSNFCLSNPKNLNFQLEVDMLDEVLVTYSAPRIRRTPEKLVLDLDKSEMVNINFRDLLKRIPGIIIANNRITYAGRNNIGILIDGKTTHFQNIESVLREIPVNQVSKVELITHPGAAYDAEGKGPLINFILKNERTKGFNGTIQTNIGYTNDFQYGTNIAFSKNKKNISVQGALGYSQISWSEKLKINRNLNKKEITQYSIAPEKPSSYSSRFLIDYNLNDRSNLGLSTRILFSKSKRVTKNLTTINYNNNLNELKTNNQYHRERINYNLNPFYSLNLDKTKLTVDLNYVEYQDFDESELKKVETSPIEYQDRKYFQDMLYKILTFKTEVSNDLGELMKIDFGAKHSIITSENILESSEMVDGNNFRSRNNSDFFINESIFALYVKSRFHIHQWQGNVGLRWEKSFTEGYSSSTTQKKERKISKLFPSLSISRKIKENYSLNFSISSRIQRPNYNSLNPSVLYYDAYLYEKGNPNLKPSYTNNFEVSFTKKNQPFLSINYGFTNDEIFQLLIQDTETLEIERNTINISKFEFWDFKIFYPIELKNKFNAYPGMIVSKNSYESPKLNSAQKNNKWSITMFLNASYKLPWGISSEVSANYSSGGLEGQVEYESLAGLDVAFSKNFLNERLKLSLQFTDIINTPFRGKISNSNISADIFNNGVGQNIYLNINYSFGSVFKEKKNRRLNISQEEENRINNNN